MITEAWEVAHDGRFGRYLEQEKILIERSKKIRIAGCRRYRPEHGDWPLEFKIDLDDATGGSTTR
ncbi:MAG: hypothetical protein RJR34_00015 [Candidatus Methanoculleus thermohydrogenotrophicum]|nr:hypothetical protein [Candidatus Methanoculleus thermohydrogenotrophicum]